MTVYAAFDDALLVDDEPRLTDVSVQCVAAAGETVLAGTFDDGLHLSRDRGDSFSRALDGERVLAVARGYGEPSSARRGASGERSEPDGGEPNEVRRSSLDERSESNGGERSEGSRASSNERSEFDGGEWWAGTEPSAVYRSADGDDWERLPDLTQLPSSDRWSFPPRPETHHVRWLEPGYEQGRWYVAIEAGALVRTEDGGETWLDRPEGARRDTHTMATHPDEPGRVYCAAGDGYAESMDGGDTWDYPQAGLDERYCWSVAVPRSDPEVRVMSAARGAHQAHRAGNSSVYRKVGDGDWQRVDDLPRGDGAYRAVLAAGEGATLHALSNRGRYRSDDAGASWERVADVPFDAPPQGLAVV